MLTVLLFHIQNELQGLFSMSSLGCSEQLYELYSSTHTALVFCQVWQKGSSSISSRAEMRTLLDLNNFDNQLIRFQEKKPNFLWLQLLKCKDLVLFSV